MSPGHPPDIDYHSHERVQKLINIIRFCIEDISLSFDRWEEPYITDWASTLLSSRGIRYETTQIRWGTISGQWLTVETS